MKTKANLSRLNITGNGGRSEHDIFRSVLRDWKGKLSYCSILAAIPVIATSQLQSTRSVEAKKQPANVAERVVSPAKVNISVSSPALLKRQSAFRLPHQTASAVAVSGADDCPGKTIPGGQYPASSPYVESGDTTGANDTVTRAYYIYYGYYNHDAFGPDHVYTFTISAFGANPQIKVIGQGDYRPLVYVLRGDTGGGCPVGTANHAANELVWSDSRWRSENQVTLDSGQMGFLPLNVPLHLFIDSFANDNLGAGRYTLEVRDVTIAPAPPCSNANPIDCSQFFARQHYLDFLDREPEPSGLAAWLSVLNNCAVGDLVCQHEQRLTTSAAFFGSAEFQLKGYFVFRFYRVAFARLPEYSEISADMSSVTGQTPNDVYARKGAFTNSFVQRPEFVTLFNPLPNADYVSALLGRFNLNSIRTPDPAQPDGTTKVELTQAELVSRLNAGTLTRAQVLRAIADSDQVFQAEFNRAFVAMQYYGYLRRTPETTGYNSWLNYLNSHPQDFREMVRGFVDSIEYRRRFGQP